MADYLVTDTELASIADAIRAKGGTSSTLSFPDGFVSAIENIPSGGGGGMIHLYTNSSFSNAYIDSAMTTSVLESYDYDINAAFAGLTAQPVLIHFGGGEKAALMVHIDHDPIDETFDICFFKSYTKQLDSYQTISCY